MNRARGVKRFNAAQAVKLGIVLPEIPTFQHCKVIPYWSRGHGGVNVFDPNTKKWKNVAYVGVPGVKDVEVLSMVSQLVSWQQFVLSSHLSLSVSLSLPLSRFVLSLSLYPSLPPRVQHDLVLTSCFPCKRKPIGWYRRVVFG